MAENKHVSTRKHWEDFWEQKKNVQEVYDNSERIVAQLKKAAGSLKGKVVLEVGAGTGRDSFLLAREGAEVIVLDYADNSLAIMRDIAKENPEHVRLLQGDAFNLPLPDNSIDIVFHQGLLEHFRDPQPILNENARVLKPGGFALVDVPQKYHVYTLIKHTLIAMNKWFAGWETEFTIEELQDRVRQTGLEVERSYGEWMSPSLFYRIAREGLRKTGVKLPLYPKGIPGLRDMRGYLRERFKDSRLALKTGLDIGVIGRKK